MMPHADYKNIAAGLPAKERLSYFHIQNAYTNWCLFGSEEGSLNWKSYANEESQLSNANLHT